jgi:hypothetical protein
MASGVYVQVPQDLADILKDDDFVVAGGTWGAASDALIVVGTSVGIGAQLTTVLLARHDLARFVRHVWAWTTRRRDGADRELEIRIKVGTGSLTLTCRAEGLSPETATQMITTVLTPALTQLANPDE